MANNNIVIDLASEAAGLPASTATPPKFPSNAKLIEKEEFQEIRLALLRLVEREGAHVNASKYVTILNILRLLLLLGRQRDDDDDEREILFVDAAVDNHQLSRLYLLN
jgi:hypothetical protein